MRVVHEEMRLYFQYDVPEEVEVVALEGGLVGLSLYQPKGTEALCLKAIEANLTPRLGEFLKGASAPTLVPEEATIIALAAAKSQEWPSPSTASVSAEHELVIVVFQGWPRLAWRVSLFSGDVRAWMSLVDATSGEVIDSQGPARFRVYVKASNPHEPFDPVTNPKSYKPFPYADVYLGIRCEPGYDPVSGDPPSTPCHVWRGDPSQYHETTDYHGNFSLYVPPGVPAYFDVRFQSSQRDLGQLNLLYGGDCQTSVGDRCGYYDQGSQRWVHCDQDQSGQCDTWALANYYFGPGPHPFGDHYLVWMPPDPAGNIVCGVVDYQNYVGTSTRSGRRQEIFYHLARIQNYWHGWLGVTLPRTRAYIVWNPDDPARYCGGGVTYSQNTMSVTCPQCAFVQRDLNYTGEAFTRSTVAHEFGHVVDATFHNGSFSAANESDLPLNNSCWRWNPQTQQWELIAQTALTEAIAMFNANWSGKHEYADDVDLGTIHGSPRNARFRYPSGYYCCTQGGGVGVYDRASIWINAWTDFYLSSGPPGLRAWRQHIASAQFAGNQLRLLDPQCINTFDYDSCPVGRYESTFYRKLWYAAGSWGMGYEAVKAWQQRIRDWDVGNVGSAECNGGNTPMTNLDPDPDYAPWFDDVPDRWWQAPILPLDTVKLLSGSDATYGPFPFGWCRGAGGSEPCDPLTMDLSSDRDYFIFYGRSGETYRIYTMPGEGASPSTDTILELRGPSDALITSNDDCGTAGLPPYGTWFSCITYAFTETQPYRLVVKPKIARGRALGSAARYKLHVEMVGDDYADTQQGASPASGSATGKIQASDDVDWLYLNVFDQADVSLSITRYAGTVAVLLMNHVGEWIAMFGLDSNNPTYSDTWTLPKGTYYLAMAGTAGATYGLNYWRANYAVEPGTARDTAIQLFDPDVPTLLPSRAITNRFQNAQKHYYRFWANRNEIFIFNVFGTARVSVVPDKEQRPDNPLHQHLVVNAAAPQGGQSETDIEWGTLLEDAFGGIRPQGWTVRSSYLSFVAPWEGWYFVLVEKEGSSSNYVLWAPSGLVWLDEPEDP